MSSFSGANVTVTLPSSTMNGPTELLDTSHAPEAGTNRAIDTVVSSEGRSVSSRG